MSIPNAKASTPAFVDAMTWKNSEGFQKSTYQAMTEDTGESCAEERSYSTSRRPMTYMALLSSRCYTIFTHLLTLSLTYTYTQSLLTLSLASPSPTRRGRALTQSSRPLPSWTP